jgi:CubicO group peptidase (beta-lactamase class C family)/D-alanyl-D-alanine dipeptidase
MRLASLAVAVILAFSLHAQPSIPPPDKYAAAVALVEKLAEQELKSKNLPAISIALVDDQTIVWAKGFGFADPAKKIPATAETAYRVGSVSKLFTDLAVMQLVEVGKLDLDAPVTKYLPDFKPKGQGDKAITLRHLMTHCAGLVREPPVGNYFDPVNLSLEKMVASLNDTEVVYPPEAKIKYSNAGVAVVGYVLQKTQNEPFAKYVKRSVLEPLGMTNSAFEPEEQLKKNLAKSIMWTLHGREFPAPTFELGMAPAGCMDSTAIDLAKFIRMMAADGKGPNGQILKRESLEEMWKPQFTREKSGVGLGFFISERGGRRHVGHDGGMYGFATELGYLPDEKLGAVVAISCDCANPVAEHIADFALEAMAAARNGKPLPALLTTKPVDEALINRMTGAWGVENTDRNIYIWPAAGRLFLLPSRGGNRVELRQVGDELIADDRLGFGTRIKFDGETPVIGGTKWGRKDDSALPPAPPDKWKGLIGEYGEDHNILTILEWNGRLTALIEWFFIYPLKEISENVYQFPNFGFYHDEKLVFERDAGGRSTKVIAASVHFVRRRIDGEDGKTFQIKPVRQLEGIRKEALAGSPPNEAGDFRKPDLVDLETVSPTIKLDIRYATNNNFLGTPFYTTARAFMQQPAAEALGHAHKKLAERGYGLLIHDAYRPWYVTKMFWEATPEKWHNFVADPLKGSRHNRGCAVDLTLYDLKTGKPIEMVGGYDEFSDRSYPDYFGGTSRQRWHRDLLRRSMEAEGFTVYEAEWWHFDYKDWRSYPILNKRFEDLK